MVLVLNGVLQDDCPMDTTSLFMQHPVYRDYAQQLLSIPTKSVGPVGLLYVGQREMAAAAPHDKNINIIGTDDATTCIIVVVRHSGKSFSYAFMTKERIMKRKFPFALMLLLKRSTSYSQSSCLANWLHFTSLLFCMSMEYFERIA